jgi:anti-anti-sigma factor
VDRPHVVSFNGELDIWKESQVEARLSELDGRLPIVIDLSEVRYLDSAFLSALVRLRRRLPDCAIMLVTEARSVRRVLELTEMHRLFQISEKLPDDAG